MMFFSEIISRIAGWCPMKAAARAGAGNSDMPVQNQNDSDRAGGSSLRRELLFTRMSWAVTGLSYILALAVLPFLPDIIPIHWNYAGVPDAFGEKVPSVFTLPVILTLVMVLTRILPRYKQMRAPSVLSRDLYAIIIFSAACLVLAVQAVTLANAAGLMIPLVTVLPMLMGAIFIVLGGVLPLIGPNRVMGIRLPWTLKDENNWRLTHERGGPVFMSAGILIILGSPFAGTWAIVLMLAVLCIAILCITIYSYRLSRAHSPGS
jgi:uncharacterized membrane protein